MIGEDYFEDKTTFYLQYNRINDLYEKTFGRDVEKKKTITGETESSSSGSRASVGVKFIVGAGAGIDKGKTKETTRTVEVTQKLGSYEKLREAINTLEEDGLCCDLNEGLRQIEEKIRYIYFKGKAKFYLREEELEYFVVTGKVGDYTFKSKCSKKYIEERSSSLCNSILDVAEVPLFSWGDIPGKDDEKLRFFLVVDVGIEWAEDAEICKSRDGRTISISEDENRSEIILDETKKKATLTISDDRTRDLRVKKVKDKLNIYPKRKELDVACIGGIFGKEGKRLELKLFYIGGSPDDLNRVKEG